MSDCKQEAADRIKAVGGDGWLACVRLCEEAAARDVEEEALRTRCAAAEMRCEVLERQATAAEARAEALWDYVRHIDGCEAWFDHANGKPCTCCLDSLRGGR